MQKNIVLCQNRFKYMEINMKKILLGIVFTLVSAFASAAYKDVVKMEATGECSMNEIVELKDEFNEVMKKNGYDYSAEIWMPIFYAEETANAFYWIGTAPDLADFGPEFTRYFDEALKDSSLESKIEAGFSKCRVELSRSGFLTE